MTTRFGNVIGIFRQGLDIPVSEYHIFRLPQAKNRVQPEKARALLSFLAPLVFIAL